MAASTGVADKQRAALVIGTPKVRNLARIFTKTAEAAQAAERRSRKVQLVNSLCCLYD